MATRRASKNEKSKLFVLDTNVLMHDPTSLYRFEEHDIYVPIMTLEELDNNKKGMSEVARNARQASRMMDEIVSASPDGILSGIDLSEVSRGLATGRLFLQAEAISAHPAQAGIAPPCRSMAMPRMSPPARAPTPKRA